MLIPKIMIVEDESIIALDIQQTLRKGGFEDSFIVNSGRDAISKAITDKPDVILMDIKLHGEIDGIEAATQIRNQMFTPIIYLTAHTDDKLITRALTTEPFGYLVKPFEEKELLANLKMAVYKYEIESKLRESEKKYRKVSISLQQRVKELECLHRLSALIEKLDNIKEILEVTVNILPSGWQYPEDVCARIIFDNFETKTKNFQESEWKQTINLLVKGKKRGQIEVFYLEQKPDEFEGPFLREERSLLITIAEQISNALERTINEIEMQILNRSLSVLFACSTASIHASNELNFLQNVAQILVEKGEYASSFILLFDKELNSTLQIQAYSDLSENGINVIRDLVNSGENPSLLANFMSERNAKTFYRNAEGGKNPLFFQEVLNLGYSQIFFIPLFTSSAILGGVLLCAKSSNLLSSSLELSYSEISKVISQSIEYIRGKTSKSQLPPTPANKIQAGSILTQVDLDEIDCLILQMLTEDGRMKLIDIAQQIGLRRNQSISDVGVRKRLSKILSSELAKVQVCYNLKSLKLILGFLLLEAENSILAEKLINQYSGCPRVLFAFTTSGKFNLVFGIIAENLEILDSFINNNSPKIQKGIKDSWFFISTKKFHPDFLPMSLILDSPSENNLCGQNCHDCWINLCSKK